MQAHKTVQSVIRAHGGIASMAELRAANYPPDYVLLMAEHRHIIRVRKGWYANTDVDDSAIRSWRVGGPLACVSALAYHGAGDIDPERLHVLVRATASRLRTAENHRKRLAEHPSEYVVVHWSRQKLTGDRIAVTLEEAFEQAQVCRPRVAGYDSFRLAHMAHATGVL
jgi:hypothetical protein